MYDLFSLQGKTILLTGASGHLGRAMAAAIAEAGAIVLVNSRSAEKCGEIVTDLLRRGLKAELAVFDVTDSVAVRDYFSHRPNMRLHGLINNAYAGGAGTIEYAEDERYLESYEISVVAAHRLLRAALPSLRNAVQETGDASVINLGSMYGLVSPDARIYDNASSANPPFYGAAKAALLQWTRYAACEFGPEAIRVNAISPGPFPSDVVQQSKDDFIEKLAGKVPLGRVGTVDEIKGPIVFLLSKASTYINGANLVVDGGWTSW